MTSLLIYVTFAYERKKKSRVEKRLKITIFKPFFASMDILPSKRLFGGFDRFLIFLSGYTDQNPANRSKFIF